MGNEMIVGGRIEVLSVNSDSAVSYMYNNEEWIIWVDDASDKSKGEEGIKITYKVCKEKIVICEAFMNQLEDKEWSEGWAYDLECMSEDTGLSSDDAERWLLDAWKRVQKVQR